MQWDAEEYTGFQNIITNTHLYVEEPVNWSALLCVWCLHSEK